MNKQEARKMRREIAQDMPEVKVEFLVKNHHNSNETYTLQVFHTTKKRMLKFNEPNTWEEIYCVWSVL